MLANYVEVVPVVVFALSAIGILALHIGAEIAAYRAANNPLRFKDLRKVLTRYSWKVDEIEEKSPEGQSYVFITKDGQELYFEELRGKVMCTEVSIHNNHSHRVLVNLTTRDIEVLLRDRWLASVR